ncbi:MAG: flagellar cap protein FliD N-terminal domain-containing protein [Candidatus Puniceispirillales bacterium]
MATDYLSALNVGSGLNTTEIISALVDAERIPKENLINSKIEEKTIKISSLGQVQTSLSSLNTGLDTINGLSGLEAKSTDTSIDVSISDNTHPSLTSTTISASGRALHTAVIRCSGCSASNFTLI